MEQRVTQVHHLSKEELLQSLSKVVVEQFSEFSSNFQAKQTTEILNRKQTAQFFGVTTVTIDTWCEKGILTSYRTGNRRFFKRSELELALTKIDK